MIINTLRRYKTDISDTFKLSLPIIFGRLGAVLMGVADNVMVGKLSYTALAAGGIANSIFILVAIIPIGTLIVGSPMISSANSRNDKSETVNILKSCIQTAILISLFFMVVLTIFAFNFDWFQQPKEVEVLAVPFFVLLIASILPLMFFIAVEQFSDGLEHTKISMFFNTSALLLNVFLNWLFIYGNWGMPRLELIGAGIGTLTARIYMGVGIWLVVKYSKYFKDFNLNLNIFTIHKDSFQKVMKQGIPSGMQFFFEVSAFSVAAVVIGWFGAIPLAAHQVALSLCSISYMISTGLASGGSIRVGYAYGTRDKEAVLRAGKSTIVLVMALMTVSCLAFVIFNQFLVSLYNDNSEVIKVASGLLIIGAIFQLGDGIQVAAIRSLLGIEDIKVPTIFTFFAYWIFGLPLGCLLAFTFKLGVSGIWIGLSAGLWSAAILLTYRFLNKASRITV
ncbi:MAG: MATE family efflux transporter [Cytophagales bacterium]